MPSRRIHFTGRRRIAAGDVTINLRNEAIPLAFSIPHLSLQRYKLPPEALVRVEAHHHTIYMPFELGTVADLIIPENLVLTEFDSPDGLRFRLKVTSVTEPTTGQLLAEGSGISPIWVDGGEESLLPVQPADLGQEVFRLSLEDKPVLLINENITQWREVARSEYFVSLVYPMVLRSLLTELLHTDIPDLDDSEDWRSLWLRFAENLPGVAGLPDHYDDDDIIGEWVEEAVSAFCRSQRLYDSFSKHWNAEVGA